MNPGGPETGLIPYHNPDREIAIGTRLGRHSTIMSQGQGMSTRLLGISVREEIEKE